MPATLLYLLPLLTVAAPPKVPDLTPTVRSRIDRLASRKPLDTLPQVKKYVDGEVSLWALAHLALAAEDEREHADAAHKQIVQQERTVATPPAVQRSFDKLLDNLPPYLKPDAFEYTLTVLDRAEYRVFTLGGGRVYISRALLDGLLADKERGPDAVAFVLAHQLGHIGLLHCRYGWQAFELETEIKKGIAFHIGHEDLRRALQTSVENVSNHIQFLYTRRQMYDADLFAWQLCRNSGFSLDRALDGLRLLALVEHPRIATDESYRPGEKAPTDEHPPALLRLRRLFMERDGQVDDKKNTYGLFLFHAADESFERCENESLGADERPIVFIHGFRGTMRTFRDYLRFFSEQPDLRGRKLLVFRYPNNASLGRSGQFLTNELHRVLAAPAKAAFVCHSAGGLVFRWYAERRKGPFDRAVLLSTPHQGTSLTSLKYLADLTAFSEDLLRNGPGALARMIPEGDGQIIFDVHADSLFLRYLGHNADLAKRYHVFSGECLKRVQAIALGVAITGVKRVMSNRVLPRIDSPVLRRQATRRIERWRLPREISHGDLVVSARSALLQDAGHSTRTALTHEQFKTDEEVIRDVKESIVAK